MQTRIQRWGNSLALRIPKSCAVEAEVGEESLVDVSVQDGAILIRPVRRPRLTLTELLEGITNDNLHPEIATGPSVGEEAW
jgi:antitoxin MazE